MEVGGGVEDVRTGLRGTVESAIQLTLNYAAAD